MSTHNLCFRAKIRKNVYPCKPQFYCIKVGCKGVFVTRTCFRDVFCICENKGADHLRSTEKADQRLCFRYIDSTAPLLSKSEISSL